ncbi:MAG: lipid-A-disaccharide synthase [Bryobacteraceae bacterium]
MPRAILVSAGEASGDLYAARLVEELRRRDPSAKFFGCTGPHMRRAGVETIVDAASLAVVGLFEVVGHLPHIYQEYKKLQSVCRERSPDLAILTDSPDFHLRLARGLKASGVPVAYLVAPQVWAWRKGRLPLMRRTIDLLLCIFPFEEAFFRQHDVPAVYIGHPLTTLVRPIHSKGDFFRKHRLPATRPLVTILPGSRKGEAARHLPVLLETVERLYAGRAASFLLPASSTTGRAFFEERIGAAPIRVIEGETWDAIAHADVAMAASGTVTVEAALLGTPMVTFYKVTPVSWLLGRMLVRVPFYSMVNLIAGRAVVPELMQGAMQSHRLAAETRRLLDDAEARDRMRKDLGEVAGKLMAGVDPIRRAADEIERLGVTSPVSGVVQVEGVAHDGC